MIFALVLLDLLKDFVHDRFYIFHEPLKISSFIFISPLLHCFLINSVIGGEIIRSLVEVVDHAKRFSLDVFLNFVIVGRDKGCLQTPCLQPFEINVHLGLRCELK